LRGAAQRRQVRLIALNSEAVGEVFSNRLM